MLGRFRSGGREMPLSVLMVSQPTVAGIAQCVRDWSSGLRAAGWQVQAACPDDGWLLDTLAADGIPTHLWRSQRSPTAGLRQESRDLRQILDDANPDVVFLHGSKAGLIGRLVTRGSTPVAFAPHSWSFEAVTGPTRAAALRWERMAARWTSRFVCVSEAERDLGYRSHILGRYVVARNGVDVTTIAPPQDRAAAREALGIAASTQALVCVGRLCEQKGQDVLLSAWPQIRKSGRTLTLVGDGPSRQALEDSVQDPSVRFTGDVDRSLALAWLAAADLVIVPSRWEGMALVPLESLAQGTPVVASDVNGTREAITDEVGAVCPPDDADALASTVNRWLESVAGREQATRQACRQRVVDEFDLRDTIATLDRALRQTVDEAR